MRTGAGSSHLPAPTLANATHWEEGAMTNPDIAHPSIRGFPFGLGLMLPFSPSLGNPLAYCGFN